MSDIKFFKNGKAELKHDGFTVTVKPQDDHSLKASLSDKVHRYYADQYFLVVDSAWQGEFWEEHRRNYYSDYHCIDIPGWIPPITQEALTMVLERYRDLYIRMRGTRTCWTPWVAEGKYQGANK